MLASILEPVRALNKMMKGWLPQGLRKSCSNRPRKSLAVIDIKRLKNVRGLMFPQIR